MSIPEEFIERNQLRGVQRKRHHPKHTPAHYLRVATKQDPALLTKETQDTTQKHKTLPMSAERVIGNDWEEWWLSIVGYLILGVMLMNLMNQTKYESKLIIMNLKIIKFELFSSLMLCFEDDTLKGLIFHLLTASSKPLLFSDQFQPDCCRPMHCFRLHNISMQQPCMLQVSSNKLISIFVHSETVFYFKCIWIS